MAKTWILRTETKGTGAEMVPLDRVATKRSETPEPLYVPPKPAPAKPEQPKARNPRRFRVVDVMTRRVLADDATGAETLEALRGIRSVVDVEVFVWQEEQARWRLVSFADQRAMFDLAAAQPAPA